MAWFRLRADWLLGDDFLNITAGQDVMISANARVKTERMQHGPSIAEADVGVAPAKPDVVEGLLVFSPA